MRSRYRGLGFASVVLRALDDIGELVERATGRSGLNLAPVMSSRRRVRVRGHLIIGSLPDRSGEQVDSACGERLRVIQPVAWWSRAMASKPEDGSRAVSRRSSLRSQSVYPHRHPTRPEHRSHFCHASGHPPCTQTCVLRHALPGSCGRHV
jgi:hypothetical protein